MRIAIIGGTGKEGKGLALRWARAGLQVVIGSRVRERAERAAADVNARAGRDLARGLVNREAAEAGEIVVLTVPYAAHAATLREIADGVKGKVFVDVTVPLDPEKPRRLFVPAGGSATEEAQALLGPETKVVAAFQNLSSTHLGAGEEPIACDVLVCGDDAAARAEVVKLVEMAGLRGLEAGPARNARVVEGFTVLLLELNRRYKSKGAGVVITGLPEGG